MRNLESFHTCLMDYYGVFIPDKWLQELVDSDKTLIDEYNHNYITDTYARGYLIDTICKKIAMCVSVTDIFGRVGSSSYPCFGDSQEYKTEFHRQLKEKLNSIGGIATE